MLRQLVALQNAPGSVTQAIAEVTARFTGNQGWLDYAKAQLAIVLDDNASSSERRAAVGEVIKFIERFAGG